MSLRDTHFTNVVTRQAPTATVIQVMVAIINVTTAPKGTITAKVAANAIIAILPRAAPAATIAAASWPRRLPLAPASRLRRISCRSIRVVLAQKIAGESQKQAADGCTENGTDNFSDDRGSSAQREPNQLLGPAVVAER